MKLLDVFGNPAIDKAIEEIAVAFLLNRTLEVFPAQKYHIDDFGSQAIARFIAFNRIARLDLGRSYIGSNDALTLGNIIQSNLHMPLRRLVLCSNCIDAQRAHALAISFCENANIGGLDLAVNEPLSSQDPSMAQNKEHQKPATESEVSSLTESSLTSSIAETIKEANNLLQTSPDATTTDIVETLDVEEKYLNYLLCVQRNDSALTKVYLDEAGLGDIGASQIGEGLMYNSMVRELRLTKNGITAMGAIALCTCLKRNINNSIEKLHLSSNPIGDAGAVAIAGYMQLHRQDSHLKSLWLLATGMGDIGASAIGKAIQRRPLEDLYLQMNNIGPSGVIDLAASLARDNVLKVLNLHSNHIGDTGITALVKGGLLQNDASPLEQLIISSNNIGNEGAYHGTGCLLGLESKVTDTRFV